MLRECVRLENGKEIVDGRGELAIQLGNARNCAFPRLREVLGVLCDTSKRAATIRFTWDCEQVREHITIAILRFNEDNKIAEIIEV